MLVFINQKIFKKKKLILLRKEKMDDTLTINYENNFTLLIHIY